MIGPPWPSRRRARSASARPANANDGRRGSRGHGFKRANVLLHGSSIVPLAALLSLLTSSSPGFAQTKGLDLANASLEDLMNIEVASVSHKEQRARADVRLQVPVARGLFLSLAGQNLFDPEHVEYGGVGAIVTPTLIPRSASITLVWRPTP